MLTAEATFIGRAANRQFTRITPQIAQQLDLVASHLRSTGSLEHTASRGLQTDVRLATTWLSHLHSSEPQLLEHAAARHNLASILDALRSDAATLRRGQLPDSPDAPLYHLPRLLADVSVSIEHALAGTRVSDTVRSHTASVTQASDAAMRIAAAISG